MYTPRQYTNVYIRKKRTVVLCRLAPGRPSYMQGLSGRGYADLCIFIQHHNMKSYRSGAGRRLGAILAALAGDLCTIADTNFAEFTFHALR